MKRVETGWLPTEPLSGSNSATRKDASVGGAMRQAQGLARSRKVHRMFADSVTGTHDRETDLAALTRADVALPAQDR